MSDVTIFIMGCFVSLVVACAVGLLLWGAANEPRGAVVPAGTAGTPRPTPPESDPAAARSAKSTSPV